MTTKLNLSKITALANETPAYGGDRLLEPLSSATILSAGVWLSDYDNWIGDGHELTVSEKTQIDELVAEAMHNILEGSIPEVSDYVKLYDVVETANQSYIQMVGMMLSDYNRIKIFVRGMRSDYLSQVTDHVKITINSLATAIPYFSYSRVWYGAASEYDQFAGSQVGMIARWAAASATTTPGSFGNMEMTCHNPQAGDDLHFDWDCMKGSSDLGLMTRGFGSGIVKNQGGLTAIRVEPLLGDKWTVRLSDPDLPDELRLTIYGLK